MNPNKKDWEIRQIKRQDKEALNDHTGAVIWFTGLSGAGKSTLASAVEAFLNARGCRTFVLDGDNVRQTLCSDLSFSMADRKENIRRIAEVAKMFVDSGIIVIAAFISPINEDRNLAREIIGSNDFIECYLSCELSICEKRDVKGLYAKARRGEIMEFTGISSPYEEPLLSDLNLNTGVLPLDYCVYQVIDLLYKRGVLSLDKHGRLR